MCLNAGCPGKMPDRKPNRKYTYQGVLHFHHRHHNGIPQTSTAEASGASVTVPTVVVGAPDSTGNCSVLPTLLKEYLSSKCAFQK